MEAALEPSHHHQTMAQLYPKTYVCKTVRHERQTKVTLHCQKERLQMSFSVLI